jgi:hypothetical protein
MDEGRILRSILDKLIICLLATLQLVVCGFGGLGFLFAMNYGGAAANPTAFVLILMWFAFGAVSAVLLHTTLTFARILSFIWNSVAVAFMYFGWFFEREGRGVPEMPTVFKLMCWLAVGTAYLALTSVPFCKWSRWMRGRSGAIV